MKDARLRQTTRRMRQDVWRITIRRVRRLFGGRDEEKFTQFGGSESFGAAPLRMYNAAGMSR